MCSAKLNPAERGKEKELRDFSPSLSQIYFSLISFERDYKTRREILFVYVVQIEHCVEC